MNSEGSFKAFLFGDEDNNVAKACPASLVPTKDWELDDPEGKPIEEVRQIRDKIKARVEELVERLL
jgi:protein-tyrosine-phosphatase